MVTEKEVSGGDDSHLTENDRVDRAVVPISLTLPTRTPKLMGNR